jgi:hypothetical protein
MRRLQSFGVLIFVGALCVSVAAPGCKKGEDKGNTPANTDGGGGDGKGNQPTKLTELAPKTWGKITGTVTYDGDPPPEEKQDFKEHAKNCESGAGPREKVKQSWLVNKENNGVSDVVIYLKAPKDKFLKVHESYLEKKDGFVDLHQPHCAFKPHAFTVWAEYRDKDGKLKKTGQKVRVKNDAEFEHNIKWEGRTALQGKGDNVTLKKGEERDYAFKADLQTPITFGCGIHPWMNATCWALDTPYAARTDEKGNFTIENAPLGVDLYIVAWHEGAAPDDFFHGGRNGTKITLDGKKPIELKVKRK